MCKKLLLVIATLTLFEVTSLGQLRFGIKTGASLTNTKDTPSSTYQFESKEFKWGYLGGVYGIAKLNSKTELGVEVFYTSKGYTTKKYHQISYFIPSDPYYTNTNLSYLSIPITFSYYFIPALGVTFGGEYSILFSANNKTDDDTYDTYSYYNTYDFGVLLGVKYNIYKRFSFEIRYTHGVFNINKDTIVVDAIGNPAFELKIYNRALQFTFCYDLIQKK